MKRLDTHRPQEWEGAQPNQPLRREPEGWLRSAYTNRRPSSPMVASTTACQAQSSLGALGLGTLDNDMHLATIPLRL